MKKKKLTSVTVREKRSRNQGAFAWRNQNGKSCDSECICKQVCQT